MSGGSVLITGASSGLGRALALAFAERARLSRERLFLWLTGRNASRLAETAAIAADLGAVVATETLDVRDQASVRCWVATCHHAQPLDIVIANAGLYADNRAGPESADVVRRLVDTNVSGMINTVLPSAALMQARGQGRILIIASLAGRLPFPSTPAYSATKAFVRSWGLSLRTELAASGVRLTVVSPGYIATPMTAANQFPMPFIVDADWSARHILDRLDRNPAELSFPWTAAMAVRLFSLMSHRLFSRLAMRAASPITAVESRSGRSAP